MKFLFDCENEELLPATFDLAVKIEQFYKNTNLSELREKVQNGENAEEKAKSNLKKMLFRICKEYPKEAGTICDALWVLDDGEKAPNAIITAMKVMTRKDAVDFFISLLGLVQ